MRGIAPLVRLGAMRDFASCPTCGWRIPTQASRPSPTGALRELRCPDERCMPRLMAHRGDDGWGDWQLADDGLTVQEFELLLAEARTRRCPESHT